MAKWSLPAGAEARVELAACVAHEVNRTHPCMVPYDQLPQEQRVKDHLFGAAVRATLSTL